MPRRLSGTRCPAPVNATIAVVVGFTEIQKLPDVIANDMTEQVVYYTATALHDIQFMIETDFFFTIFWKTQQHQQMILSWITTLQSFCWNLLEHLDSQSGIDLLSLKNILNSFLLRQNIMRKNMGPAVYCRLVMLISVSRQMVSGRQVLS